MAHRRLFGWTCVALSLALSSTFSSGQTWTADNGNGTFSNPLFYDEFSDPDLIRVGDEYFMTGTTMHTMPGLPVLRSVDLVNWEFLSYAAPRLDFGPEYRLEDGKTVYGRGIWAPSFRHYDGTFYIFAKINGQPTKIYSSESARGPWEVRDMDRSYHDMSILFDDDGKKYMVWGYQDIQFAQLTDDLTATVPGTRRTLFDPSDGMGEGAHFYKIDGKYYICSAVFHGRMKLMCARSSKPEGPYEVQVVSEAEDYGLGGGASLANRNQGPPFEVRVPDPANPGYTGSIHQGGIVETPSGEWWGFSMLDANSVGRLTCLSPVTWKDGWPCYGLPGNLVRSPRTWVKPDTGRTAEPSAPYERSDDFSGDSLKPVWQWNHHPVESKWSLTERPGCLRLHALPAKDFWFARNTLTQRAVGPVSNPTVELDASGLAQGDVAGLALLNLPYAWVGVRRTEDGLRVESFDQTTLASVTKPISGDKVWLRAECDYLTEQARLSYSVDGQRFEPIGEPFVMVYQLTTFQGIRYGLFSFNQDGKQGGYADFDSIVVDEPHPRGLMRPIPLDQQVALRVYPEGPVVTVADGKPAAVAAAEGAAPGSAERFEVVDRGLGRVALKTAEGFVSVDSAGGLSLKPGTPGGDETFQWIETFYGDLTLMSLATNRYLRVDPDSGELTADYPGPQPGRRDGSCFSWRVLEETE